MIAGIELETPPWLLLWPGLMLLAWLWRRLGGPAEPAALAGGTPRPRSLRHPLAALAGRYDDAPRRLPRWKYLAWWLALGCLSLALAAPVRIGEQLPEPPQQRDILFIVDVSVAMLLRDYELDGERVRRIDMLKQVLARLVRELDDDRIGLVVFGENAHTLVPLTADHRLLRQMLERLHTDIAGRSSALGDAVAMAVHEAGRHRSDERRILVLFSDARLSTGTIAPLAAAQLAAEARLPLYTVAIGAATTKAAEQNSSGLLHQPADLALLRAMAERTGAGSYHATATTALEQAVRAITARQGKPGEIEPRYAREPLYPWPLLLAACLLLLARLHWRRGRR